MTAIVERLSVSPRVERIGDAELWLGDCREIAPTLPRADALISDPPYGVSERTNRKAAGRSNTEAKAEEAARSRDAIERFKADQGTARQGYPS